MVLQAFVWKPEYWIYENVVLLMESQCHPEGNIT